MNISFLLFNVIFFNLLIFIFSKKLMFFFNIYDYPDSGRKFHKKKTSLFGGTVILLNIIFFCILNFLFDSSLIKQINLIQFSIGSFLFYLLGLIDDKYDLNSNLKFLFGVAITLIVVLIDRNILIDRLVFSSFDLVVNLGVYSHIFSIICIIIFINALNMFDGINLQAGTYCFIVISSLFFFSDEVNLLLVINISLVFFLYLNYNSKLFLGDSGTHLLGFIIAYLVIYSAQGSEYVLLTADKIFMIMILPGLELIRLFFKRILKKKHPFSSDRNHIHHILLDNFNENQTLTILNLLNVIPVMFIIIFNSYYHFVIFLFIIIYLIIIKKYQKSEK